MLRSLVKDGAASALYWTRADALIGRLTGSTVVPPIVTYHRVVEDFHAHARTSIPAMLVSRRMLERHLDWMGLRFRFVSLDELGARLESGRGLDERVAAISFDDGYQDVYDNALPLLKRKGIPAAVFVVTDHIDAARGQIYDELYLVLQRALARRPSAARDISGMLHDLGVSIPSLQPPAKDFTPLQAMRALLNAVPQHTLRRVVEVLEGTFGVDETALTALQPLTWAMLSEMRDAGVIVGSHTRTHALLPNESVERVWEETMGSRQALESKLGTTVHHFAYPNGWFDTATVRAVAASGYRFAYTTCRHRDADHPFLTVPRIPLWEHSALDAVGRFSPALLSAQFNRLFDVVAGCRQDHDA